MQAKDKTMPNDKPPHQPSPKSSQQQATRQTGTVIDSLFKPKTSNEKQHFQSNDVFQQLFPNGKPNGIQINARNKSGHTTYIY